MKVYKSNEIKNVSLIGGKGSGKTTLAESILFECGVVNRRGKVTDGNTVCDYFPVEKEYGYSVFSTLLYAERAGKKINFIDCPGMDDFAGNVVTALNVTDAALMLVDGQYGVEVGTQNQYRTVSGLNKPLIMAINKLEAEKSDFDNVLSQLKEAFGNKVVPIQFPVTSGTGFNSIVDLLTMKQYTYGPDGGKATVSDIDASAADKAEELKAELMEAAAGSDDALMEKFFEEMELNEEETMEGLLKGIASCSIIPVICVSGEKNMGVDRMLEVLANIVPSPCDMPGIPNTEGEEVKPDANGPVSLFFFKTTIEPHIGEVSYFKVMSGTLKVGTDLNNANRGSKERIAQINVVCGQNKQTVDEVHAGDIAATVKLKDVRRGNTLNDKGCENMFDYIEYPAPKYQRAIKPLNESEIEKLGSLLNRMHEEDPTWLIEQSKELKQTIISGQGEFHLRTLKWRLENNEKLMVEYIEPKIPYRETITKAARADYRHKKQSGGSGQFGEVHLIVEPFREGDPDPDVYRFGNQEFKMNIKDKQEIPMDWGGMLVIYNCIVGGAIDARFIPAIVKGIKDRMEQGPLTGSYARDVRVCIYDGKMHPVDSNEISFVLAARHAFSEAFKAANPKVLEPVYDVEILLPSDAMGGVQSDLQGRRGIMMDMSSSNGLERIKAKIPLKEMASYSTALSSISGGRASFSMKFASYELVPADVQEKLLKAYEEANNED
ncbi:elongation factor G [Sodaliphilus sp.]|uniref:elongation factor G n=1 Tax=Sodaliphilus sp. TaxID=2815818 RepID=UPI00388D7CCC